MAGWQDGRIPQINPNLTPKPSLYPTSKGSFRRLNSRENFGVSRKQTTRPLTRNSQLHYMWDDENNKWWFSAIDIVRAINDEDDYVKAGNYWRWLKRKLNTEGVQLVSVTHDFKFQIIVE